MKTVFIYALKDPRIECPLLSVRYVGKAANPKKRFGRHLYRKGKHHCACWIQALLALGLKPILEIVDDVSESEWQPLEAAYIEYFRECGCDLTNATPGGDGFGSGENSPNFGKSRVFSLSHRANISAARAGMVFSEEHRKNLSAAKQGEKHHMFGTKHSPKTILLRRSTRCFNQILKICQPIE